MHDGMTCAVLSQDGKALITGGEDGLIRALNGEGAAAEIGSVGKKWVTTLAAGPQGAVAWAAGKTAFVRLGDGTVKEFSEERSIEGLAFAPKGMRLATARYNGGTLHWVTTAGKPIDLEWKGAHTGICFSPDGKYVVTTMQENALHGWRLDDMKHMRMSGYPAKVKSWSWSAKGKWLATSGAPAAIVWPFQGKDGPMGKAPLELGTRGDQMVTSVACHPERTSSRSAIRTAWCWRCASTTARKCCCAAAATGRSRRWPGTGKATASPSAPRRRLRRDRHQGIVGPTVTGGV
jgi:WD40 repeat protein